MNSEKTMVYWIGLILLSAASVALFGTFWKLHLLYIQAFERT